VDINAIRPLLDAERRTLARDDEVIEVLRLVTRLRPADGAYHLVVYSALTPRNADAAIAEQVGHYRAMGKPFEWKVYGHDRPADLLERLRRQGFSVGPKEAVVVLDQRDPPAWVDEPPACEVVRVGTAEHVKLFHGAASEIFGKDYRITAGQLERAIAAGSRQHVGYLAMIDGAAASVGRLYTHPDSAFGGLYGGGTRATFRGRGLYRALVAARARDARDWGAQYLVVDALPTSRPILERLGFVQIAETWPCEWKP
jgi:GNAT superfamily N-acetyltransferase